MAAEGMQIKLKANIPEIILGVFLTLAVFAVGTLFSSSVFPPYARGGPDASAQERPKQEVSKAGTDERIADYTWWLAMLTGGLVLVAIGQGVFIARSDKTARIAANAADLSARAAVAIQLPIIRVVPDGFGYGASQEGSGPRIENCAFSSLGLMNHGRTEAFPVEVRCGWAVERLPDLPVYTFTKVFPVNLILKPGPNQTEWLRIAEFPLEFPSGKPAGLHNNAVGLWFYCSVAYFDFMQSRHEAGFCWRRWDVGTSAWFREDATPAYNRKT